MVNGSFENGINPSSDYIVYARDEESYWEYAMFYKLIFFEKIESRFKKRLLKHSIAWKIYVLYIFSTFKRIRKELFIEKFVKEK